MPEIDKHKGDPLFDEKAFFELPEAGIDETGITPLKSRYQPTGFMRGRQLWRAISTPEGLKRERMS